MSLNRLRSALFGLAALATTAGVTGCAEERDPINRVQANALDKSFFVNAIDTPEDDPEFWTQATLIDVGYGASQSGLFTSTYTQGVARIKWQITEDLLLGRLTYERIANSDGKGAGASSTDGQVVVAYPILKHFDIRHAYNPSTGEELNVIEENTSDRPWYERQYMRVDWSKNINTDAYDFDTLSMLGAFGVDYEPLAYYVNDPNHEDAPFFDVEDGYFDVTNKAFASPGNVDLSHLGWGIDSVPACWLDNDIFGGSAPAGNCNSTELTIRQAFRKVVDTDYEPADWDGRRFQAYGGFYTERYGYARNFGMSDDQWHRFLTRYNIWERSHYYADPENMEGEVACYTPETLNYEEDPHADVNPFDGTEDRCWMVTVNLAIEAGDCSASDDPGECYAATSWKHGGSRCDTFKQKCTLPYRHRTPRPLAWHYTNDSNPDYFDGSEWATHDHDVGMRHAIQVAKYAECMATAGPTEAMADRQARCLQTWPVYRGQMDDHLEAKQLAKEVDDCRHGLTYPDAGAVNSEKREQRCQQLADEVAAARGANRAHPVTGFGIDPGVVALAKMPEQIVLCHSPVEADDPAVCAPADERLPAGMTAAECQDARDNNGPQETLDTCRAAHNVRIGDLRHHLVNVIQHPQTPSPWGIYTDAEDPLTGETFSAAINVWSHVNDLWSQLVLDRVRYIKGELETSEVTEGEYVQNWAQAAEAANGGGLAPKLTYEQRTKRVADFAEMQVEELEELKLNPTTAQKLRDIRDSAKQFKASADAATSMAPVYHARRESLKGTALEAELITPMMQQLAGTEGLPPGVANEQASIFGQLNPTFRKEMRHLYQMALAKRGMCVYNEAPAPMAITGLADALEQKFSGVCAQYDEGGNCLNFFGPFGTSGCTDPADLNSCSSDPNPNLEQARAEMMRQYLAQKAHYAVIVHEMGHSVGERHNFVSSSDPYNYRPQYWQLRTNDGLNAENTCQDYDETGACIGPRYYDPVNEHERQNMIWMWMHSSVMDYAGEYTQDFLGLAGYDMAAHRMFYGENVAVYNDPNYAMGSARAPGVLAKMDNFGGILGITYEFGGEDIHYTELQRDYQLIYGCEPVDTNAYVPASWDASRQGAWHPVLDGFIVANEAGTYTKCRQQMVDYVPWQTLHQPTEFELSQVGFYNGGPAIDPSNRLRVPYGFATDSWADLGNASVYRHDNGADVYEIFNFLATQQEVHHIFDNYRRGRQSFSVRSAASRTLGRYNEKIRDGAKGLGLLRKWYEDIFAAEGTAGSSLWAYAANNFFAPNVLASGMVFDHFAMNFARPEAGPHYLSEGTILKSEEDSASPFVTTPVVTLPNGASGFFGQITAGGKLVENRLADDKGEFDRDFTINAGSYYDKVYAPYLMTESVDNFISDSRNDFVNGRYRAVSLADLFPEGYRRWLANNLTGDDVIKGPRLAADAGGNPLVDFQGNPSFPIGWTTWWGDEVRSCFPASGTWICDTYLDQSGGSFDPRSPDGTIPIDPQIGYEQHKFLIAQTMMYLPEDHQQEWLNQMKVYRLDFNELHPDNPFIEFHDPEGNRWVASTFGTEEIFGKTVQRGVAARMLEYANELVAGAYENTPICFDYTNNVGDLCANLGMTDDEALWYEPTIDPNTGRPIVKYDPSMIWIDPNTGGGGSAPPDCNDTDNSGCTCEDNRSCTKLRQYTQVIAFLSHFLRHGYDHGWPAMKGVYD